MTSREHMRLGGGGNKNSERDPRGDGSPGGAKLNVQGVLHPRY